MTDATGGPLPGATVELRSGTDPLRVETTDERGAYRFEPVSPGPAALTFTLANFAVSHHAIVVSASQVMQEDAVLQLALTHEVAVTARRSFTNLGDAERPSEDLVGVAHSASQGAVTARQVAARPMMRTGEVLEAVPGVVISQHSGEGKANQYFLRGFNLDHGTDFATTVAGMPVNLPTHGHGHGYSDLNFMIPELISSVQFSKGPYFAEQGDFSVAGSATIDYVNRLERPIAQVSGGALGWARAVAATSSTLGARTVLGALEVMRSDGPWDRGDDYRRTSAVLRYSRGDALNGYSLTGMWYRARWNASDQIPQRAVASGQLGRFATIDTSAGGETTRLSTSFDWQRSRRNASTRLTAFGIGYGLDLFSNFTYALDDPARGDQFQQVDRRLVSGLRLSERRIQRFVGRQMQHTMGLQMRHDHIARVGLYRTEARERRDTVREDAVFQTSAGLFAQNDMIWSTWLRSQVGVRVDAYRFDVNASDPLNSGVRHQALVSPKGSAIFGPFADTEIYVNAGTGFHSNDARGVTLTRHPASGQRVEQATPLVRATGGEIGLRTVALPHLQSSIALWTLTLDSELLFIGDAGTTEAGRPSRRYGVEISNFYRPLSWLTLDADVSWSHARFRDDDPSGPWIPGAVQAVASGGFSVAESHGFSGSLRVRHVGGRPLVENKGVQSRPATLVNSQAGYRIAPNTRLIVDMFNLFDAKTHDVDYYYTSRLPGEPAEGVADIHFHPVMPRTVRATLAVVF